MTERFRILSLDGGGVRGAYSASVLKEIEEGTGRRIVDHFDLIAGTSTGGIIAIALGLGLSAAEIVEFYRTHSGEIFPATGVHQRLGSRVRQFFAPKYHGRALEKALKGVFGDKLLGDSTCRLVIPSYDAIAGDVHVFKTRHTSRVLQDHKRRAVEVALATSAAPTFLPMSSSSWGQKFLDGGVWANCPSTLAVLEAAAVVGVPLTSIHLLSIGTTTEPFSIDDRAAGGGLVHYRLSVIDLLQNAQVVGSWAQTRLLLRDRATRISYVVSANRFALDDSQSVDTLIGLGVRDGRHHGNDVASRFLDTPVERFVPTP